MQGFGTFPGTTVYEMPGVTVTVFHHAYSPTNITEARANNTPTAWCPPYYDYVEPGPKKIIWPGHIVVPQEHSRSYSWRHMCRQQWRRQEWKHVHELRRCGHRRYTTKAFWARCGPLLRNH